MLATYENDPSDERYAKVHMLAGNFFVIRFNFQQKKKSDREKYDLTLSMH